MQSDHAELAAIDSTSFGKWAAREHELRPLAGPLLDSPAINRLGSITFLGVLSPRFASQCASPILRRKSVREAGDLLADGSRRSHSIGVALITLDICRSLGFSDEITRYAVAWALVHDLGNWPLSHTGEYAFANLTRVKTKELRIWLINGDLRSPSQYWVKSALDACGIDVQRLTNFLRGEPDIQLVPLHNLVRSPLTPDMLEGVWRSGRAFGISAPEPDEFRAAFWRNLLEQPYLKSSHSGPALKFWRCKADIYRRFFNARTVAVWESSWSRAIEVLFGGISLEESLSLAEHNIVESVIERGLSKTSNLCRWKNPRRYLLRPARKRKIADTQVQDLEETFADEPLTFGT